MAPEIEIPANCSGRFPAGTPVIVIPCSVVDYINSVCHFHGNHLLQTQFMRTLKSKSPYPEWGKAHLQLPLESHPLCQLEIVLLNDGFCIIFTLIDIPRFGSTERNNGWTLKCQCHVRHSSCGSSNTHDGHYIFLCVFCASFSCFAELQSKSPTGAAVSISVDIITASVKNIIRPISVRAPAYTLVGSKRQCPSHHFHDIQLFW